MKETVKIKGMVCRRCIDTVQKIYQSQGFAVDNVELGEVTYSTDKLNTAKEKVRELLNFQGFEILDDKQTRIINKVKELVDRYLQEPEKSKNFTEHIASSINADYDMVSTLFSQTEGTTLEQYIIHKRIDRVKELLIEGEQSLTDVAFDLGYSSIHHLSNQFKKVTGMSPTVYQKLQKEKELN